MTINENKAVHSELLDACNLTKYLDESGQLAVMTPVDGTLIATLKENTVAEAETAIELSAQAFREWRMQKRNYPPG